MRKESVEVELPKEFKALYQILVKHRADNPIKKDELLFKYNSARISLGLDKLEYRSLRIKVKTLTNEYRIPVGFCAMGADEEKGTFIIESRADYIKAVAETDKKVAGLVRYKNNLATAFVEWSGSQPGLL